jgi:hypothetical protein
MAAPRPALYAIAVAAACAAPWARGDAVRSGTFEIVAQTVMPHLEENLRYATTRERRCLSEDSLTSVFPVLRHWSLDGCRLRPAGREGDTIRYVLACENPQVATGAAWLEAGAARMVGALEVKMGGKNMTFAQRVEATRKGDCDRSP